MPKRDDGDVKIFNIHTGTYEPAKADDKAVVERHEAIAEGKPLPGDRTAEELRSLEPGMSGPTLSAGPEASVADVAAPGRATTGTRGA